MKTPTTIATLFITTLCFQSTNAFLDMAFPAAPTIIAPEAVLGDAISPFAQSPIGSSTLEMAQNTVATAFTPEVESEVLEDMAHMALDFSGILFRPTKKTMRLYSLGGRLLGLMADYIPDHSIHTEELVVQLFFIGMTLKAILEDELQFAL